MGTVLLVALAIVSSAQDGDASKALERLVGRLADEKLRAKAAARLVLFGEPAVAPLVAALEDGGHGAKAEVLRVLGRLGPRATSAIHFLAGYVRKAEPGLLVPLVRAIADITPYTESDSIVRRVPFAHTMLVLRTRFRDKAESNRVAIEVHRFMLRRDFDVSCPLEELIRHVQENKIFVRVVAAEALGRRGPAARDAAAALADGLEAADARPVGAGWHRRRGGILELDDDFRRRAAEALLQIAPDHPRAAVAWGYRLQHAARPLDRAEAARALARLGPAADLCVDELGAALTDEDPRVVIEAAHALGRIGRRANGALERLERLKGHASPSVRKAAEAAIERVWDADQRRRREHAFPGIRSGGKRVAWPCSHSFAPPLLRCSARSGIR